MNDIQIGQPWQLHWLWMVIACAMIAVYASIQQRRALRRFASPIALSKNLLPNAGARNVLMSLLAIAAMVLVTIALVDLRWGKVSREVPQKGIEVMFVLDVSRSMLAEDTSPNRLERAKQQIGDIMDAMTGDRVGLVLFSGEVRQSIPLTNHYEDFRQQLRNVGPEDIPRGGSRLGDAIRVASRAFLEKTPDHKAIVIFTDGEDMESEPIEAARAAKTEHGIRIFCVGLGDSETGTKIPGPTRGRFIQYQGQVVLSKLNSEILKQVADETGGAYIPAGTKQVDMAQVYHGYIASIEQGEFGTAKIDRYEARYQWFLAPAVLLLLWEVWLMTKPQKSTRDFTANGETDFRDPPVKPIAAARRIVSDQPTETFRSVANKNLVEQS